MITRTRGESIQALDLVIVGVARTPNPKVNQNYIYLPLDTADAALGMEGHVTEIVVRLAPGLSPRSERRAWSVLWPRRASRPRR